MRRDYRFWNLIPYNISPVNIYLLYESGENLDNFLLCNSKYLKEFKQTKEKQYYSISVIIKEHYSEINDLNSIYILVGVGVRNSLIRTLVSRYRIRYVDELIKEIYGPDLPIKLGPNYVSILLQAIKSYENLSLTQVSETNSSFESAKNISDLEDYIQNVIESNYPITSFKLLNIIKRDFQDIEDIDFKETMQKLLINKKISFSSDGYVPNLFNIEQFLMSIVDERKRNMLVDRLNGLTLEEIAEKNGLTRERVRQIIDSLIENRKPINEDKFKEYFKEYNLTVNQFSKLFGVSTKVYYLFSIELNKGLKTIFDLAKKLEIDSKRINEINFSEKMNDFLFEGEVIKINANSIIDLLIKKYRSKVIKGSNFYIDYCDFVNKNLNVYKDKLITNERNFLSICERSQLILNCNSSRLRYYDSSNYDLNPLKELFEKIENNTFISTESMFSKNRKLMRMININDQYELHSLLRRLYSYKVDKYTFHRMPMIQIGTLDKKDFVLKELSRLSPTTVKEFVNYFRKIYGYDGNSFKTYISTELMEFTYRDILDINFKQFKEIEVNLLRSFINDSFISLAKLDEYIKHIGLNPEEYINNLNIKKLGLLQYSTYCISNKFKNSEAYFRDYLLQFKKFYINKEIKSEYKKIATFNTTLSKLLKELVFIQIDDDSYAQISILMKSNITEKYLREIISMFEEIAENNPFVSIDMVDRNMFKIIEDNGIELKMVELLLKNASSLTNRKLGDVYIFSKLKQNDFASEFIGTFVDGKNNYKLYDLRNTIQNELGINLEEDKIKDMIMETNLFYSSDLEAVFKNKESYYREIYANEEFTFE